MKLNTSSILILRPQSTIPSLIKQSHLQPLPKYLKPLPSSFFHQQRPYRRLIHTTHRTCAHRSIHTTHPAMASSWSRLVRFAPVSAPETVLIGEPVDASTDVGNATRRGESVSVAVYSGSSILDAGDKTDRVEQISRVLAPLSQSEVGTIRCIGLNYTQHATEARLPLPTVPVLFLKPATALSDPYPAPTIIPACTLAENSCDYESELAIIIGSAAKNVPPERALAHVLGFTAANDVSARRSQFAQSQWCYSKGFDGSCPLGPAVVSARGVSAGELRIRGLKRDAGGEMGEGEGRVMQDCGIDDLVFGVEKLVSFLSQGTTLQAGTVILTGTPAGVGGARKPREFLKGGDEFGVEVSKGVGTLWTRFEEEKVEEGQWVGSGTVADQQVEKTGLV